MDKFNQHLYDVIMRSRDVSSRQRQSKAAAMQQPAKEKEMVTICKKEYMDLQDKKCANVISQTIRKSMAASLQASGINPAQMIHNFIFS